MKGRPWIVGLVVGPLEGLDYTTEVSIQGRAMSAWQIANTAIRAVRKKHKAPERILIEVQMDSWKLKEEARAGKYRQGARGIEKICTRCRRWFLATGQNFGPRNDTNDGMNYYCRKCQKLALERSKEKRGRP